MSEFGTRRRRTYWAQKQVIEGLIRANKELLSGQPNPTDGSTAGVLVGTSNVRGFSSTSRTRSHLLIGSLRAPLRPHASRDDRAVGVSVIDENQVLTRNSANGIWALVNSCRF